MSILELQILSPIRWIGLCIIIFNESASATNQKEFHQFLPVFLTITSFKCLDAPYKVLMLFCKLALASKLANIGFRTNAQIGFIIYKQT